MDKDGKKEKDELSLDAILAEFSGRRSPSEDEEIFVPRPVEPEVEKPSAPPAEKAVVELSPPAVEPPPAEEPPRPSVIPFPTVENKVLEFPTPQKPNPVAEGIGQLRQKADEGIEELRQRADDFAGHMFEDALSGSDEARRRAEKLIPGVDEEEVPPAPPGSESPGSSSPPPRTFPRRSLSSATPRG